MIQILQKGGGKIQDFFKPALWPFLVLPFDPPMNLIHPQEIILVFQCFAPRFSTNFAETSTETVLI